MNARRTLKLSDKERSAIASKAARARWRQQRRRKRAAAIVPAT